MLLTVALRVTGHFRASNFFLFEKMFQKVLGQTTIPLKMFKSFYNQKNKSNDWNSKNKTHKSKSLLFSCYDQ